MQLSGPLVNCSVDTDLQDLLTRPAHSISLCGSFADGETPAEGEDDPDYMATVVIGEESDDEEWSEGSDNESDGYQAMGRHPYEPPGLRGEHASH